MWKVAAVRVVRAAGVRAAADWHPHRPGPGGHGLAPGTWLHPRPSISIIVSKSGRSGEQDAKFADAPAFETLSCGLNVGDVEPVIRC